jgi:polyhydroxyalkanoate synthesis repressor PhaR
MSVVLVKRYANRKLYNTESSRYITLKGIAELIEQGREVRVVDNETGEDITSIALSQILVDSEREARNVPGSVLSELISKGGDALYTALRRGVDEAQEGIDELRRNVRRALGPRERESGRLSEWLNESRSEFESTLHGAVERVFRALDLPRRSDIEALNANLERVAKALEQLDLEAHPRVAAAAPRPPREPQS